MSNANKRTWLPKHQPRKAFFGNSEANKSASTALEPDDSVFKTEDIRLKTNVQGKIVLPNGHSIIVVRSDVMNRALNRGEFTKK